MVKCAIVTSRLDKPSFFYRFIQHEPFLKENNINVDYHIIKGRLKEFNRIFKLNKYKVIIFHRTILSPILKQLIINTSEKHLVFDFDDAIMFSENSSSLETPDKSFYKMIRFCDTVISGNKYLDSFVSRQNTDNYIIPTPVDLNRFTFKEKKPQDYLTIGWIGSSSTTKYLLFIKNVFLTLKKKYSNINFLFIADRFDKVKDIPAQNKIWNRDEEVTDLHLFDIGIMPLTNDIWSRGKCGFKLLQYMATGVPSVSSPVGVNAEIIKDGENGFLAYDEDEWISKLSLLIENYSLRTAFAKKALETVKTQFSTNITGPLLVQIIKKAAFNKF